MKSDARTHLESEVLDVIASSAHETGLIASPAVEQLVDALVDRVVEQVILVGRVALEKTNS